MKHLVWHMAYATYAIIYYGICHMPHIYVIRSLGTMEELFEILTWQQLGYHAKPCGLINTRGYFDHLLSFIDHAVSEGFLQPAHRQLILVDPEPQPLLDSILTYKPELVDKWGGGNEAESNAPKAPSCQEDREPQ